MKYGYGSFKFDLVDMAHMAYVKTFLALRADLRQGTARIEPEKKQLRIEVRISGTADNICSYSVAGCNQYLRRLFLGISGFTNVGGRKDNRLGNYLVPVLRYATVSRYHALQRHQR